MKRRIVALAVVLALPLLGSPSFAQTQTQKPASQQATRTVGARPVKLHRVFGQVVSMDETAKTVVLKETFGKKSRDVTYAVAEEAASALSQLKTGDHVKVSYSIAHGKRTAESIVKTGKRT